MTKPSATERMLPMDTINDKGTTSPIRLLIVDDSLVFRRFLRDIFEDIDDMFIVGEAENGIDALDLVLKTKPELILLDLEMPLMDGMTTLQHLMIHRPTPTIMFSSLSEEGTARCFDTLKNGAVDFICKNFIFHPQNLKGQTASLVEKVRKAARMRLPAREPAFSLPKPSASIAAGVEQRVVFCEECGNREIVTFSHANPENNIHCSKCREKIELLQAEDYHPRRNTCITVIGGGAGSFSNLLGIVPFLHRSIDGAVVAVIHESTKQINNFVEYLDAVSSMKVVRIRDGITVEGGNCYIGSGQDLMSLRTVSGQFTLQKIHRATLKGGPFDILLASIGTIFKKRSLGIVLSGKNDDGDRGMMILKKNGGQQAVLAPEECLFDEMGKNITHLCELQDTYKKSAELVEFIKYFSNKAKYDAYVM
jgi:two-component system chemotaxis response regulator CheB